MPKPNELDATTLVAMTGAGRLMVEDVARSIIDRVAERDAMVGAWAHFDPAQILAEARRLDALPLKGPLHGVPVGIKDVINTRDMPTAHNTARYQGSRPGVDAACVDMLRTAGALIVGKTVTTEFATTNRGGKTHNPHAFDRTPGGSSSGSGASVADFQATIALGTQTGGSTIRPASFCGIYGWKPTWNSISREGLKMYSATCDTLGLYARSAGDLDLLAETFRLEPADLQPTSFAGARVGICRSPVWDKALPATEAALASGIEALKRVGAVLTEIELPKPFDTIHDAHRKILRQEGRSAFLNEYAATPSIHEDFRAIVENRESYSAADSRQAYRTADECRGIFDEIASAYDVILTPSATGEAPLGIEMTGDASFNSMWTLLQVPVVNVPGLLGPSRYPVGLSIVGRRYDDRKVIAFAGLAGAAFTEVQRQAA